MNRLPLVLLLVAMPVMADGITTQNQSGGANIVGPTTGGTDSWSIYATVPNYPLMAQPTAGGLYLPNYPIDCMTPPCFSDKPISRMSVTEPPAPPIWTGSIDWTATDKPIQMESYDQRKPQIDPRLYT